MFVEVQCDGLIGPTHNYSGLSFGNIASESNANNIAYPKQAALQGLEKMHFVYNLGIEQIILPPPLRPNDHLLKSLGINDTANLLDQEKSLIRAAWSASTMWSANAATVSPSPDTSDNKLHMTIANLANSLHRSQEAQERYALLQHIFGNVADIHPALPACVPYGDEGAANHMRLCPSHGKPGVEVFVYGRDETHITPRKYPARQTLAASQAITRLHHLNASRTVFALQHPKAIDAGVFHNDVIAMSNESVMIYHTLTFADEAQAIAEIQEKADFPLTLMCVDEKDLSIRDAVSSYFYNSQLLSLPDGGMAIIAPIEVRDTPAAHAAMQNIMQANDNPVNAIHYLDVRESMRNGGGPACLRLRVVMEQAALARIPASYRFSKTQYAALKDIIEHTYPDEIAPDDLTDPALKQQVIYAHNQLMTLFI